MNYIRFHVETDEEEFKVIHEEFKKIVEKYPERENKIYPVILKKDVDEKLLSPPILDGELRLNKNDFDSILNELKWVGKKAGTVGFVKYHVCNHAIKASCPPETVETWGGYEEIDLCA